jgi:predicted nuclease with TOPRIM domain
MNVLEQIEETNNALRVGIKALNNLMEIRAGLEQLKSQLLDTNKEDSVLITTIELLINKTYTK